ncbi:IS3 family transposase [Streptomyces sp. NBC_00012]
MKVAYIDQHKDLFGVQPICDVLAETDAPIAPSTYYAAHHRLPSARSRRDEELTEEIRRIHTDNYGVYGARKVHAALVRENFTVARCTVERLMRRAGLRGVIRAKSPRTTRPAPETDRPADLVERQFTATPPRTSSGSRTSPTSRRSPAGSMPPSSSTSSPAWSPAGRSPHPSTPNSPWTPWRWLSGDVVTRAAIWPVWSITPIAACSPDSIGCRNTGFLSQE